MDKWEMAKKKFYGVACVITMSSGLVNFDPRSMESVEGKSFQTYDEYLEAQRYSCDYNRRFLEHAYYYNKEGCIFIGEIDRAENDRALFRKIVIYGSKNKYFHGIEENIMVESKDFECCKAGDQVIFDAKIRRVWKENMIDYDLKQICNVEKAELGELSDMEDLIDDQIHRLMCESCRYIEECHGNCMMSEEEYEERFQLLKNFEPGKFTVDTVMLAYELEYRLLMKASGYDRIIAENENDLKKRKLCEICKRIPVKHEVPIPQYLMAMERMGKPQIPRIYIGQD